jgi:8-amino-7-oxononanoate synthase
VNPGERASWSDRVAAARQQVVADGRWRAPRPFDARGPVGRLTDDGADGAVVSFASNDYLGLTGHPAVVAAAHEALDRWGSGSGASRLVTGSRPVHDALEAELAAWAGAEAAVCFPTGFAANLGVLTVLAALGGERTRIVSDEKNHASIIDGCRLARAEVAVARHADPDHVAALLAESEPGAPTVVVSDTVFSMDGDEAPLDALVEVCRRAGAALVLDDAHAVFEAHPGPRPADGPPLVVRVGTLSKTLGSLGGYAVASRSVAELLVNLARPYIFTTALSPADAGAALAAVRIVSSPEGDALRRRLRSHVDRIRPGHPSAIVPVIMGSEQRALAASASLLAEGLWVPAIRPPTVAPGTSRLRVTLSAAHSDEQVGQLAAALAALGARSPAAVGERVVAL